MDILQSRSNNNLFKLQRYTISRHGRTKTMDTKSIKARSYTNNKSYKEIFYSPNLMTRYCKLIGQKYPDHLCTKCEGEENYVPDVQLELKKKYIYIYIINYFC